MKKLILLLAILFGGLLIGNNQANAIATTDCKGVKLNTNMPFIGNCINVDSKGEKEVTPINAFPVLIGALMNLLMTIILIMSLLMIVWSGVLMTMGGMDSGKYTKGVKLLTRVVQGMALLGASGVILKVINPNFFV